MAENLHKPITVNLNTAEQLVDDVQEVGLVPAVIGHPGIAKSSLHRKIAEKHNEVRLDERVSQTHNTAFRGYPDLRKDSKFATFKPFDNIPLADAKIPDGYTGWNLLFDEAFDAVPPTVQSAMYRVILDKEYANKPIHPKVKMMLAGNLMSSNALAGRISTAMQSRIVWFELVTDHKITMTYAAKAGWDYRVIAFLHFKPEALNMFDPEHEEKTYPCERTWEMLSMVVKKYKQLEFAQLPLIAGCIGDSMGREFFAFSQIYDKIPSFTKILASPKSIEIPNEPSVQHALASMVGHNMNQTNAAKCMEFITRLPIELQFTTIRNALYRNRNLQTHEKIGRWLDANVSRLKNLRGDS